VCVCVVLSSQSQALPRYPLYTMTHRTNTVFSSSVCKHLVPSNLYHAVCIIMPCAISCRVYHHAVCIIMPCAISCRVQFHGVCNIMPCAISCRAQTPRALHLISCHYQWHFTLHLTQPKHQPVPYPHQIKPPGHPVPDANKHVIISGVACIAVSPPFIPAALQTAVLLNFYSLQAKKTFPFFLGA